MPYKLTSLTPMLETRDLQNTIDFYTGLLGFTIENYYPYIGWVALSCNQINLMFTLPNRHSNMPATGMSGSLYINAENVNEIWERLKDKCTICYPIEDFDYGMREFAVYDNNGYLLQFGQEIELKR